MATKYDWEFIKPLDQSSSIANMALGNKQITDGLQGMVDSVTGLSDAYKQRNTDEILNALYAAQTSSDLPTAMNAVQALQAQYGRGYDQAKVREAIDTRGSTLGQRDLQAINLQQAQAAQAALPQIKQMQIERLKAIGAPQAQIDALNAIDGIDVSNFSTGLISDAIDKRNYTDSRNDRAEDIRDRKAREKQAQDNWEAEFGYKKDRDNWERAGDISKENPASVGYGVDENGNPVLVGNSGVSRMDAYGALSGLTRKIVGAESNYNPNAKNSRSTATGAGQFLNGTWIDVLSRNRPDLVKGKTPEQILALRKDPKLAAEMTEAYANENAAMLKKAGLPVTEGTVYLAHFAGPGGARSLLRANPNASAESILGSEVARANPSVVKGKTVGQVIRWAENKMGGQSGGGGTASQALANVGGGGLVSQAAMSEVSSGYQNAIAKLTADFNAESLKSQQKGSLAETGKSLSTWAAGKKDNGIIFSGNNSWFTSASDLVDLAKKDATFSKLPETAQMNILEGAYAKMNDVNKLQYVPDGDLQKFISNESKNYHTSRKDAFNQAKEAAFEQSYQAMVQAYQAVGARPPSREGARKLLDPQSAPAASAAKPQPTPQPKPEPASTAAAATAAVATAAKPKPAAKPESKKAVETLKQDFKPTPRPYDNLVLNFPDAKTKAEFSKKVEESEKKAAQARKAAEAAKRAQKLREEAVEKRRVADILVKRAREDAARKAAEEARRAKFRQEREARLHPPPSDEWLKDAKERLKKNR